MNWKRWIVVEWASAFLLFLVTSLWWLAMLSFASQVGTEDLSGLPFLFTSLFLFGWPVALLVGLSAFIIAVFAWRNGQLRLTLLASAAPFIVWLVTALPFQIWFFLLS